MTHNPGHLPGGFNIQDLFLDAPEAAFFSAPSIFGGQQSPQKKRFFGQSGIFNQVQNQFFGALGQQIRQDQAPTLRFEDFLADPQQFNPTQFFQRFGPPDTQSQFNPATRFLFF